MGRQENREVNQFWGNMKSMQIDQFGEIGRQRRSTTFRREKTLAVNHFGNGKMQ